MKGKWLYVVLFVAGVCLGALLAGGGGVAFYKKNVFVDVKIDVDVGDTNDRGYVGPHLREGASVWFVQRREHTSASILYYGQVLERRPSDCFALGRRDWISSGHLWFLEAVVE